MLAFLVLKTMLKIILKDERLAGDFDKLNHYNAKSFLKCKNCVKYKNGNESR